MAVEHFTPAGIMRPYLGYVFIFLAAFCWGLTGPVARFSFEAGLTPPEVAFWRSSLGGLFFMIHAGLQRSFTLRSAHDGLAFVLFGVISIAGLFASYQYAIKTGGAALAAVLLYTAPAWVAVFSRLLLGELLTPAKLVAIAMSLTGVMCVSISSAGANNSSSLLAALPGNSFAVAGILFGLLAGLLYSTHYIFSKTYLKRYSAYTLYGYCMLFGALALLPFTHFMPKAPRDWCVLLFLGFVCTYAAYGFYCEGLKRLAPAGAAVLATLEPVVATLVAWWLWGENFTLVGWAGAVLILGAVLCLILAPDRETSRNTPHA